MTEPRRDAGRFFDQLNTGDYLAHRRPVEAARLDHFLAGRATEPRRILDFGCGQGGWLDLLAARFPKAEIWGVDVSRVGLAKAAARRTEGRFIAFDGRRIPLADHSFDLVFSVHVLEYVPDIRETFSELARLLKPGGTACLVTPCADEGSLEQRLTGLVRDGVRPAGDVGVLFHFSDPNHRRRLTSAQAIELAELSGLTVTRLNQANQFWGAVEWMAQSSPELIGRIFPVSSGWGVIAKIKLLFGRLIFLTLSPATRLNRLAGEGGAGGSFLKKLVRFLARLTKPLTDLQIRLIERRALAEWAARRSDGGGSLLFLAANKPNRG